VSHAQAEYKPLVRATQERLQARLGAAWRLMEALRGHDLADETVVRQAQRQEDKARVEHEHAVAELVAFERQRIRRVRACVPPWLLADVALTMFCFAHLSRARLLRAPRTSRPPSRSLWPMFPARRCACAPGWQPLGAF
jgi:hypothetical protein